MRNAVLVSALLAALGAAPAFADEPPLTREQLEQRKRELREESRELREQEQALAKANRKKRKPRVSFWGDVGINFSDVERDEESCGGTQGGLTVGKDLLVRVRGMQISFEGDDDTDTCDVIFWGDSYAYERTAMAGLMLGQSGVFILGGPASVSFEGAEFPDARSHKDTGAAHIELGWSSRIPYRTLAGVEVFAFWSDNDIRDFAGLGLAATFGTRR